MKRKFYFSKSSKAVTFGFCGSQPGNQPGHQCPHDKRTHSRHTLVYFLSSISLKKFILSVRHFEEWEEGRERNLTFIQQLLYTKYRNKNFIIAFLISVIDTVSCILQIQN